MYQHAARTFEAVKANLGEYLRGMFPVEGKVHKLVLKGLEIRDNADIGDYDGQRAARMDGRSWSIPILAQLELQTLDGKVVDRARVKLVDLPHVTNRGSYIVHGTEYMFPTQKRLRSGPYVRLGENDELRTFFNLAKGRNFHLGIHPQKGHFQFQIESSKNIPLYPLLTALGVGDEAMIGAWGRDVWKANVVTDAAVRTKALATIWEKMSYGEVEQAPAADQLPAAVATLFSATGVDGGNAELTVGVSDNVVTGRMILAAATKMLKVARGETEEDDRDSLIHNDIVDLGDFIVERFRDPQFRGRITRTIKFNIDRRDKISQIISRDAFQRPVDSMMTESQLAQTPTQSNPLGMISDYTQITVRGEGGIQQDNALTRSLRALDPSHLGFIDPAHTPEGSGVGTTLHLTLNTEKRGRDLVTRVLDVRTGKMVDRTPVEIFKSVVAFPEHVRGKKLIGDMVIASHRGKISRVPARGIDYAFVKPEHLIDANSATIPFISHNNGTRVMTASKMGLQAKPLADGDVPMVQVDSGEGETVEKAIGTAFSPQSPVDGIVSKVADDHVVIAGRRVSLPHYFPLNSNNFMHARATVKVGQRVKKGQVIADTNYTRDGTLSLGKNLRVAYVPYKGMNVEDGVVISESAGDKLASEHLYQQNYLFDVDTVMDLKKYRSYFPAKLTNDQAATLDDQGVIKKGQIIQPGTVLVAAMRRHAPTTESQRLAAVSRMLAKEFRDDSLVWDKSVSGVVQDVAKRAREIVVFVRTREPVRIGDKIVGRYGNKGVVVVIVPDSEMPRDARDRPMDLLLNPNGVVSRMNLGQILETTASRVAEKTGKPFALRGFGADSANAISSALKKAGVKDHETIHDPVENVDIPGILVGSQHIYKLEHQATKKISSRGGGSDWAYSHDQQPIRGPEGGRAIGTMELYALLAHGATANVEEMYGVKSNFDYDTWKAIESGAPLPPSRPGHATQKFLAMLRGMGVDVEKRGNDMVMVPFLDRQVKALSNGQVSNFQLLRGKDLREEKDGLFDVKKTGGVQGEQWTHIRLPEPVPNPTFEDAIVSILHLSREDFEAIVSGSKKVGALTGGAALKSMLDAVKVDARIKDIGKDIVGKTGSELNKLHKELRYLRALKDTGTGPGEYVISLLPVLPPKFRPVYALPDGNLRVSDVNFHYQATMQIADQIGRLKGRAFGDERRKLANELYKSVGGIMGLNDGVVERRPAPKGLAAQIAGVGSPKGGFFHEHVLKKRQDVSATAVVTPDPTLGLDEVGIPEAVAWNSFRPFLVRELRVMGMTPLQARDAVDKRGDVARKALENVMARRHVILNRAPSLHKFSVMAFKPRLVPGYAIKTSPMIVSGLNMDFDGNCVVGSSRITLTFAGKDTNLRSLGDVEEVYGMKFTGETRVVGRNSDGLLVEMEIKDVPYHPDTKQLDANGASVFAVPDGLSVWSYDHGRGTVTMSPITHLTIEDDCQVARVVTRGGLEVTCSTNESLCVFDHETGDVVDTKPTESIKCLSPVARHVPISGGRRDFGFGWMVGAFASDGFFTGRGNSIGYAKVSDEKRAKFTAELHRASESIRRTTEFTRMEKREGDLGEQSKKKHFYGVEGDVMEVFYDCYTSKDRVDGERSALRKKLPATGTWSEDALWGLLCGLIDGDGSVSVSNAKKKSQVLVNFSTSAPALKDDIVSLCRKLGIRCGVTSVEPKPGRLQKHVNYVISLSVVDVQKNLDNIRLVDGGYTDILATLEDGMRDDRDIVPVPRWVIETCSSKSETYATIKSLRKPFWYVSRATAREMIKHLPSDDRLEKWRRVIEARHVHWDMIESVEDRGRSQVFDLVVPDTKVFAVNGGLVVWDTMGMHVPVGAEANAEAAKMLPSRNLYKPGSGKLQQKIEHEYVLGLFKISRPGRVSGRRYGSTGEVISDLRSRKIEPDAVVNVAGVTGSTTPGRVLINDAVPARHRDYGLIWTDRAIQAKLVEIDKGSGRQAFVDTLQALADIGRRYAYTTGSSFLLSDLQTMSAERNAAYRRADVQAARIRGGPGTEADKDRRIVEVYKGVGARLQADMHLRPNDSGKSNNVADMVAAGARGNPDQVRQMVSSIGVMLDHDNRDIPEPVRSTYTEGLSTSEFFSHMYGNRKGMIDKSQSVKDPGALTKQVIVSAAGYRVTMADCGTSQGIMESGTSALDRYLAEAVAGVGKRNELVTRRVLDAARAKGLTSLRVRSPMTCTAPSGVCARCYGLDEEGKPASIGDHVGIKDTQGLTEPSTQLALKTFHTGGISTGKTTLSTGFDRVKKLFTMPDTVRDKAVLSETGGRVESVGPNPFGGTLVTVAGVKHRVPVNRAVAVRVGDQVVKGQRLSDGDIQPQDMLRLNGLRAMQVQLRDDIGRVYAAGGEKIHAKTIEVPVRMLTESVRVSDAGDHPSLVPGDYGTYGRVDAWNRENAGKKPVKYVHVLPGSEYLPHRSDDWAQRLAHNRITQVLQEAPAMGARAPLAGGSPFAALVFGKKIEQDPWRSGGLTHG